MKDAAHFWEECRGIGRSFGCNRAENARITLLGWDGDLQHIMRGTTLESKRHAEHR